MRKDKIQLQKNGVFFSLRLPSQEKISKAVWSSHSKNYSLHNFSSFARPFSLPLSSDKYGKLDKQTPLIICDKKLFSYSPEVKVWLRSQMVYFVSAGEKLKDLNMFPWHSNKILKKIGNEKISYLISVGGGSVADFSGFFASVYKRGVPLIHIPSTWLCAMDASHGGKTALNIGSIKNQFGSYVFPRAVFIVKELFSHLPSSEVVSSLGELIKMACIRGGKFYSELCRKKSFSSSHLWSFLPEAIIAKLEIVNQDPFETKGFRRVLNFGHTLGHVLESHFTLSHGIAVLHGIFFSVCWSHHRFGLSNTFLREISQILKKAGWQSSFLKKIPMGKFRSLLLKDKKRTRGRKIDFLFTKGPGQVFVETVSIEDILQEVRRQVRMKRVLSI